MMQISNNRDEERKTYFAKTNYRGKEQIFGIKAKDRLKHVYVIGKTGMGKSVLLENMAIQDIRNGNGLAFIDPHGSGAEKLLDFVPESRKQDIVYFAPFDMDYPISFNIMEDVGYDKRHLVVSNMMSAFRKIWPDVWSSRMEYILQNALLALLEAPDSTLLSVNRMLIDKDFRKQIMEHVTDPVVRSFWLDEFTKYTDRYTQEATPAIQNKIGQFISNPVIRNIIGQPHSSFDPRKLMDERKILVMNLSKGRMGDTNSRLLGSMLIVKIYLAAMSRADVTGGALASLPPFYFYIDEFQSFANETFADILSEARKYKLALTIAHQYTGQMPDEVKDAIFGNVGTLVTFRIGAEDAEILEKEFAPTFSAEDMVSLGAYQIYLKLMIDGLSSKPFSAMTLPPLEQEEPSIRDEIIRVSREQYAKPRAEIEELVRKSQEPVVPAARPQDERRESPPRTSESERSPRRREESRAPRRERTRPPRPVVRSEREERAPVPAPPAGHSSFKDALADANTAKNHTPNTAESRRRERNGAQPVSPKLLRRNNESNAKQTAGHLADLRAALDKALGASNAAHSPIKENPSSDSNIQKNVQRQEKRNDAKQQSGPSLQQQENSAHGNSEQQKGKKKTETPEIPEDELRAMLRVKKEQ